MQIVVWDSGEVDVHVEMNKDFFVGEKLVDRTIAHDHGRCVSCLNFEVRKIHIMKGKYFIFQ